MRAHIINQGGHLTEGGTKLRHYGIGMTCKVTGQ